MEFTLLLLGIVGAAIWWRRLPKRKNDKESKAHQSEAVEPKPGQPKSSRPKTEVPQTNQATTHEVTADMATIGKALADQNQHHQTHDHEMAANKNAPTEHEEEPKDFWPAADRWLGLVVLSLVLTVAAVLGWWSTEVLYAEQVIYSYDSQFADTLGTTAPKK
jgi:ABC-type nickel/cobalt efflux system permease component RcnA